MHLSQPFNHSPSDEELACCLQRGDRAALPLLMQRHKEALYRTIWRYTGEEEEAFDLLQETFLRVHQKIALYNPDYRFKPWLYQIAINLCRDHLRLRKLRQVLFFTHSELPDVADDVPNMEDAAHHRQRYLKVQKGIDALPFALRTAFILAAVEGNTLQQCAEILGVTAKTVETRVYRARKILTKKFEG